MKDPRLIEVELLADIERQSFGGGALKFIRANPAAGHDLLREEAVLHLLFDGAVIERDYESNPHYRFPQQETDPTIPLRIAARRGVDRFFSRDTLALRITQRGRLRLYRLRDEILNKDKLRDDFGVLWAKRHWAPDLDVRLLMHDFAQPFSLLLLDVDRLKALNSAFQNTGADEILRGMFQVLRNTVPSDAAYRLGGDEAGAFLAGMSLEQAEQIAEEVRGAIERAFASKMMPDNSTPTVSIGVGVSLKRISGRKFEEAVEVFRSEAKTSRNKVVSGSVP